MISTIPLIIFAGGRSSRMGQDKSLLPFGKYPSLTQFQYERLKPYFKDIYISSKRDKFNFDCKVIKDRHAEYSPLIALISIFETLDCDEVFILSVDAPFVDIKVIKRIVQTREDTIDVVIAKSPSGMQPLCGCYKKYILTFAYAQLEKNNHKLRDLLELVPTKFVPFKEDEPFTNLNHLQEYEEALKRF